MMAHLTTTLHLSLAFRLPPERFFFLTWCHWRLFKCSSCNFRGGTCMLYQGKVCQESLKTLPDYRNTTRFIDNKFGLPATEKFLKRVIGLINQFATSDKKCSYILTNMLCHYTVPPCYPDGSVVDYCKGDCEAIFEECSKAINQAIGGLHVIIDSEGIDFIHRGIPDCSKHHPRSYYESLPGNKTCIKSGFFSKSRFLVSLFDIKNEC